MKQNKSNVIHLKKASVHDGNLLTVSATEFKDVVEQYVKPNVLDFSKNVIYDVLFQKNGRSACLRLRVNRANKTLAGRLCNAYARVIPAPAVGRNVPVTLMAVMLVLAHHKHTDDYL